MNLFQKTRKTALARRAGRATLKMDKRVGLGLPAPAELRERETMRSPRLFVAAFAGTAALCASSAFATPVPPNVNFVISQAGGPSWDFANYPNFGTWSPDSSTQNLWHYTGAWTNSSWTCNWALDLDADPFVSNSFAITNNTGVVQTYSVNVTLPVFPAVPSPSATFGSVSGSLGDTNNNGFAQWATVPGSAFYTAIIDGVPYQPLLPDPSSVTTPGIPGATVPFPLGPNFFSFPGGQPGVVTSIGITNTFTLTPGDSVTFVSTFRVDPVPAPAVGSLLGLGGLVALRRRRAR